MPWLCWGYEARISGPSLPFAFVEMKITPASQKARFRCSRVTHSSHVLCCHVGMDDRPTVRQVYALAVALCGGAGEAFPETRAEASEAIERLRLESGHPAPQRLSDVPLRPRRRRGGRWRPRRVRLLDDERRASEVAGQLVSEMH